MAGAECSLNIMHLAGLHRHTLLPTATDVLGNSELLSPQNRTKLSIFAGENVLRPIAILFQALLEVMEGTNHCHGDPLFGSNTPESSIAFLPGVAKHLLNFGSI